MTATFVVNVEAALYDDGDDLPSLLDDR